MKRIALTHGKVTLVDDRDFSRLSKFRWFLSKTEKYGKGYAVRHEGGRNGRKVFMHKEIVKTGPGMETDHRNGDPLDNRRSNLRKCTRRQNSWNNGLRKNNTSGYRGVSWNTDRRKWVAAIHPNGRVVYLGIFRKKKAAARAYNTAAKKYYGRFAWLNKV